MFKEMSKFQLLVIGFFAFAIVGGLLTFSLAKGRQGADVPLVTIWGTLEQGPVLSFVQSVVSDTKNQIRVQYRYISPESFDARLLEALATGNGPDAILVTQESLLKNANKIRTIPYSAYPEVDFKSSFLPEAELFLNPNGVMAVPFAIDPMVMYWNRRHFTNANISVPPKYWDQFVNMAPSLTLKDEAGNITQSAVAFGEYANIEHAKDILSMLMLQAGNPIVAYSSIGYKSTLIQSLDATLLPTDSALTYYTQFADPRKEVYSWNRALKNSTSQFLADKLSMYFGYASELSELRAKNPNLDFDVTVVPQPRTQAGAPAVNVTHGRLYGFALLASSPNPSAALNAISYMTTANSLAYWSELSGLPAVRRDALEADPADAASSIFARSALISKGWLDPDDNATNKIFQTMIESVTSGRALNTEALSDAKNEIDDLLDVINK
jgi:multiple sugar transport system substrate-binding protein